MPPCHACHPRAKGVFCDGGGGGVGSSSSFFFFCLIASGESRAGLLRRTELVLTDAFDSVFD